MISNGAIAISNSTIGKVLKTPLKNHFKIQIDVVIIYEKYQILKKKLCDNLTRKRIQFSFFIQFYSTVYEILQEFKKNMFIEKNVQKLSYSTRMVK